LSTVAFVLFAPTPLLFRYKSPGSIDPADELFVLFNPIRDRHPERAATSFLNSLKDGRCETAIRNTSVDHKHQEYICQREIEHRLTDWALVDRTDEFDKTHLHYKAFRADYPPGVYGNAWLTIVPENGEWKVHEFEAWY